ncbi:MAG: hypothetical protein A2021_00525 [Elusimicrobia bacterium GWF2_52_66]|nr:MAG: hypothetical protein A2X33_06160 [Elusimicrobia bacterium GWA2_51_34]OGR85213.1 MAG: hypothetical protein A2021_00525 [Elusimicrobia bacterium GWF2_52_66]HAF94747.1 hypothetical protein [Elusimicrobiota bacterium]HCE97643.1 hypothetical protein [Elusimicrobiota bacterium]
MEQLFRLQAFFKNMASDIVIIYSEKGIVPFKKPLLFALPVLLGIYAVIYAPLRSKLAFRSGELLKFEVISQNYQEYRDAKTNLSLYQAKLPLLKDKGEWLSYLINANAKKNGIDIDSLRAQEEVESGGFLAASRSVSVTTSYVKLGAWLADIENSPIFIKVTELRFKKLDERMGMIQVDLKLSTVFPRFGGPAAAPGGG